MIWQSRTINDCLRDRHRSPVDWSKAVRDPAFRALVEDMTADYARIVGIAAMRRLHERVRKGSEKAARDLLAFFAKMKPATRTKAQSARHAKQIQGNLDAAARREAAAGRAAEREKDSL
jgi:hypothetical protein